MPSLNVGEIILRGSVIYLFLFILLRILRRGGGNHWYFRFTRYCTYRRCGTERDGE